LDRLAHVPGVARFEQLPTMRTFAQITLDDQALGILENSFRTMAGLFDHGCTWGLSDRRTID
jgi:hypothetical protein